MRWRSRQTVLTFLGGIVLLVVALLVVDLLAVDVFLVLFVPFVVLVASQRRPVLHWTLFAVIAAATVITLVRIEASESSTAGFGVVVVPLLLTSSVLLAAVFDRFFAARVNTSKP
jgi:hypothetical protein